MGYVYLAIAIGAEVVGTLALKASAEFTKLIPSMMVIVGYAIAFFFLALAFRTIAVGIAYAVWGGVGIGLIVIAGAVLFNENSGFASDNWSRAHFGGRSDSEHNVTHHCTLTHLTCSRACLFTCACEMDDWPCRPNIAFDGQQHRLGTRAELLLLLVVPMEAMEARRAALACSRSQQLLRLVRAARRSCAEGQAACNPARTALMRRSAAA